jgi:hypothetical protein
MPSTADYSSIIQHLRRRVVVGNVMSYAGVVGALLIYFSPGPVHPFFYALAGVAVGSGTGLAYLSLLKIKRMNNGSGAASE